ncbi:MAG: type IV secretory system conjugative DNA transfer family protein [Pyrinomonadaceae bacterium]
MASSIWERIDKFDAVWQLKRPANFQHLLPYQAVLRWMGDGMSIISILFAGLLSAFFIFLMGYFLEVRPLFALLFLVGMMSAVGISISEVGAVLFPYYRVNQLTTYGTSRWAELADLKQHGMVRLASDPLPPGWIVMGRFKRKYVVVLPPWEWLRHIVVYGNSGSGKTKTFFMGWLRNVARGGSAVVIDPKAELSRQTGGAFKRRFHLNLKDPSKSDRWNFVPRCSTDPEFAHTMAAMMIGLEHAKRTNQDPFWGTAEHVACTAILMYLATVVDVPTPPMVYEYAALRDDEGFAADMANSENYYVKLAWRAFQKAPKPTQGSVMIGLTNKLYPFFMQNARCIFTPPTAKELDRGVQEIDFTLLQEPGTGIFIVIPEGDASRYKEVLATFVGQAVYTLRADDDTDKQTPCMFLIEEAYNIPVAEIKQVSGVGRGRGIGLCLCYQNYSQPLDLYGRDGAGAILGTVVTTVILPGCDEVTAEYASKRLGPTTTLSRTDVDAPGKKFDNRRASETGRPLRFPNEIRQMTKHTEAYIITDTVSPIRVAYPEFAVRQPEYFAPSYGMPKLLTFEEAELLRNEQRARQLKSAGGSAEEPPGGDGGGGGQDVDDEGEPEAEEKTAGSGSKPAKGGAAGAGMAQVAGSGQNAGSGPKGRKEKPAARGRSEEAVSRPGTQQPSLWVGADRAIKDGARSAVEEVGARARVIKKTVERDRGADVHEDDVVLNRGYEHGSPEHVDSIFTG